MIRRPPSSTRTYPLFPYTTLFRSVPPVLEAAQVAGLGREAVLVLVVGAEHVVEAPAVVGGREPQLLGKGLLAVLAHRRGQIGRAHVCTPVTNAHLVCRPLLEKKKSEIKHTTPQYPLTILTQT